MSRPRAETMPAVTVRRDRMDCRLRAPITCGDFRGELNVRKVVAAIDLIKAHPCADGSDDSCVVNLAVVRRDFDVSALSTT